MPRAKKKQVFDPEAILSPTVSTVVIERGEVSVHVQNVGGQDLPTVILALQALFDALGERENSPVVAPVEMVPGSPPLWVPYGEEGEDGQEQRKKKKKEGIGFKPG